MRPKIISMLLMLSILFPAVASAEIEGIVPYQEKWGIYKLDPSTWRVNLVYTTSYKITAIRLNNAGDTLAFSQRIDGDEYADEEICTLGVDGTGFRRLTNNDYMDVYPVWSPDGSRIAFLSWPSETLDMTVLGHAMMGFWLWLFALGALSLLCGTLFLESNRALSASGILIVTQYVMTRLGGLGDLSFLKDLTVFNYLSTASILQNGGMIMSELAVVVGVGVVALVAALYVFQTRELAY